MTRPARLADDWVRLAGVRRDFARLIHQRDMAVPDYRCPRCGEPVDWALPYRDPATGRVNGRSKSVDHVVERQDGGALLDPANAATVHLVCNSSKGSRRWHERRAVRGPVAALHVDPATL